MRDHWEDKNIQISVKKNRFSCPIVFCLSWSTVSLPISLSLSLYPNLLSLSLHPIPLFLFISLLSLSSLPHSSIYIYISLSTAEDKNPATAKNSGRTYLPDRAKCAFNKLQGNMGMNYWSPSSSTDCLKIRWRGLITDSAYAQNISI